jgi:hypothetical protein
MGYRNQSGDSQFKGSTQPQEENIGQQILGSVVDVFGTELINIGRANRLRKEVNNQLAQESMKNQQILMGEIGGFGKVEGDSLSDGPDSKNLQDVFTPIVSELSKSQLNLSQHGSATYTYKYTDPVTGEESMRNREDDEAIVNSNKNLIRSAQDLVGANEYNIGVIETAIQEGKIGNGRGEIPLDSIDPYVYAAALSGSALNGQNVKERYFFEKDENGNRVMMIEFKGQSIAQVNKAQGKEGDTHVTNLNRLSKIQSSGSALANNAGGSNKSNDFTQQRNESLQKSGVFGKESQFNKEFYIAGKNFDEVDGRTKTTYNTKSFDYNTAKQSTDAISKSTADHSVRGGVTQTLIDMRAYSVQETDPKTGEVVFSIVPGPEIDADGLIMYDEKKNPKMKDPIRLLDEDGVFIQENFPDQKIEEVLKDVMQQSILLDGGAYNQQEKTKVTSSVIPVDDDGGGGGGGKLAQWEVTSKTNKAKISGVRAQLEGLTASEIENDPEMVARLLGNVKNITNVEMNQVRVIKDDATGQMKARFVYANPDGATKFADVPLDDLNNFEQQMQNISKVMEINPDTGEPELVGTIYKNSGKELIPTPEPQKRENKVKTGMKLKNITQQGSEDDMNLSLVENIKAINVGGDMTLGMLAEDKDKSISFEDNTFSHDNIIIGDVKIDIEHFAKKLPDPNSSAANKKAYERMINQREETLNRIMRVLKEQDLYKDSVKNTD